MTARYLLIRAIFTACLLTAALAAFAQLPGFDPHERASDMAIMNAVIAGTILIPILSLILIWA